MRETSRTATSTAAVVAGADGLTRFIKEVFMRASSPDTHAEIEAEILVWTNLRGWTPAGWRGFRGIWSRSNRRAESESGHDGSDRTARWVLIEPERAVGLVAVTSAMASVLWKAKDAGVGLELVWATTYTAAHGYHKLMTAIALAVSIPNMVYHGARSGGINDFGRD
jgi:LDH2 family malate/lactate/ureidoglycolate dehydrogenase